MCAQDVFSAIVCRPLCFGPFYVNYIHRRKYSSRNRQAACYSILYFACYVSISFAKQSFTCIFLHPDDNGPEGKIQPKFLPSGTIKNPVSKGKPVWDD